MMIFSEYLKISLWMTPILLLALWLLPKISQRYTAKLSYFVWLVIAVRLVVPWNLTLPAEKAPLQVDIPQQTMLIWTPMELPAEEERKAKGGLQLTPGGMPETENEGIEVPSMTWTPMQVMFIIWLAGAIFSMVPTAVSTLQLKKLLRRWEKAPSPETAAFYEKAAGEKRPPLAVSPALETPMAVGLFQTKIYLPHEEYTAQELEMIFRHELIHWRRKDLWYKFLLLLARSIHWFHPFVWLMAKRANRDLEISCDGEAVKEKDMAYRKAYSLMILQEAERGLQKQAALTTCFTDGKRALQERLVEVMNGKKRKKGMALVAMTLVLALSCGCLVSYGGADTGGDPLVDMAENAVLTAEQQEMVRLWAEALSIRDGKIRYDMMGEKAKTQFEAEQKAVQGEDWDFNIGGSSPWVMSYEVDEKENAAIITYTMQDSIPQCYTMKELLKFGEENGKTVVESYLTSNLYWEDGKVHPVVSRAGAEIDEGIWDFMYQSVVGAISQGEWHIYELEEFNFEIQHVTRERLSNGRDEVTVDFHLNVVHNNPFRDPDDVGYIKRAKEAKHYHYEVLYDEYYQPKDANFYMRFTCQVQPDAAKIHEDTCYPDTFRVYTENGNPHEIVYSNMADGGMYQEDPADGWFCYVSPSKDADAVTVHRQIRIQDTEGRTNNGYFDLRLEQGGMFEVAEDAVITMGEAGIEPVTLTKAEWIHWLKEETNWNGGDFTLCFEKDENGYDVITEARQGCWKATEVTAQTKKDNIPSGYPTDSREITTAFAMWHPGRQHTGLDFSTENQNIPVYATADGIILEAGFDATKGNYVKINHLNGYTTLYAHLSKLDVKAGDQVKKGHVLGLTGKTGTAVGIHCHYEIQLNGIYQDPANYL